MKYKEAVKPCGGDGPHCQIPSRKPAARSVKLDRSRWEGCPHCIGRYGADYKIKPCGNGDLGARAKRIEDEDGPGIILFIDSLASGYFNIAYCPICGKPLTEKAWAEMGGRLREGAIDMDSYPASSPLPAPSLGSLSGISNVPPTTIIIPPPKRKSRRILHKGE